MNYMQLEAKDMQLEAKAISITNPFFRGTVRVYSSAATLHTLGDSPTAQPLGE
jgi:hypothetical protein